MSKCAGRYCTERAVTKHGRFSVRKSFVRPPAPPVIKLNMGEFPSGQRGQTVNLLSSTSMVRIHLLPPKNRLAFASLFFYPLRKQWYIINDSDAIVVSHQSFRTVYHHAKRVSKIAFAMMIYKTSF